MIALGENETVVTAYAEAAKGPGWRNAPIWVVIRTAVGTLREECIQPGDQTDEMLALYGVAQAAHVALTLAVARSWRVQKHEP